MFPIAGAVVGCAIGATVGKEIQYRLDARERNRAAEDRVAALRTAMSEAAVREEAQRQGVDVEALLANLESSSDPVYAQQVVSILSAALSAVVNPTARATIEGFLAAGE